MWHLRICFVGFPFCLSHLENLLGSFQVLQVTIMKTLSGQNFWHFNLFPIKYWRIHWCAEESARRMPESWSSVWCCLYWRRHHRRRPWIIKRSFGCVQLSGVCERSQNWTSRAVMSIVGRGTFLDKSIQIACRLCVIQYFLIAEYKSTLFKSHSDIGLCGQW